jgi:hypothetical protein
MSFQALSAAPEPDTLDEFYAGGPRTFQEAFPPACITSRWDPTAVSQYVLPWGDRLGAQTMDPRPAARICAQYYTQSVGDAPIADPSIYEATAAQGDLKTLLGPVGFRRPAEGEAAVPPGSAAGLGVPYAGYNPASESDLFRLDEELTKCKELRYQPRGGPAVADASNIVPGAPSVPESEHALVVGSVAGCREADDSAAWNRSARLFNNSTKIDRYVPQGVNGDLACRV